MARLSKAQAKQHQYAVDLLKQDRPLTMVERLAVLENWHEAANHLNSFNGAFFTPSGLARDFRLETQGTKRVLDLCAGIGSLSFWVQMWRDEHELAEITCVEINPDYCEVGRKIVPRSTWICADALSVKPEDLGQFDLVISNPPFGEHKFSPLRPKGMPFELAIIQHGHKFARDGAWIVPQNRAPYIHSGRSRAGNNPDAYLDEWQKQTGIELGSSSIETTMYDADWKFKVPTVEVITSEAMTTQQHQTTAPQVGAQGSLF